ncbi:HNH endonuclease [Streptomyces luteolus]|uniref:HNH endonuclease n=1 Tax=Streptomyces luteolus TaxID=3043615 RepID=A0ABT6SQK3_9ACTN|nr:HNH endonuclease [Streptomyces sp. B-S-A12]MDI3417899.1 HNH endonuclease [Streptomyces sp. B-S-A12]
MSRNSVLNSTRRRLRKEQLARRDGQNCAYCRCPFDSLRDATLDHVAPRSLWRTWTVSALVLACTDCNHAKADRFPLSLALVLVFTYGREQSAPTVHDESADSVHEQSGVHAGSESADPSRLDWRLLARLASSNQSTYEATGRPDRMLHRSPSHLHESTCHRPVRRTGVRPDCLRAPRPVRACSRPTGEAVFA